MPPHSANKGPTDIGPPAPKSAGQLEKLVRAYAREHSLAEKRVRDWVSYMVIGGTLTRSIEPAARTPFSVTGGIALELRRPGTVRATKDMDLTYHGDNADMVIALEDALTPYGRFTFQRNGEPYAMDRANTVRVQVAVRFDGTTWGSVPLDINRGDGSSAEVEMVDALSLHDKFGVDGPAALPCLSLRFHLAHKLHGATRPDSHERPNDRVQDVVDLLLFADEINDASTAGAFRAACIETFAARATHPWPPAFEPPARWQEPFERLADELNITPARLTDATTAIRALIDRLEAAVLRGSVVRYNDPTRPVGADDWEAGR